MKNKALILALLGGLFLQSIAACRASAVSSQDNAADGLPVVNKNLNQPVVQSSTPEKTVPKPNAETIKLTEKLKKKNLTKSDYLNLRETLGWKDFCQSDEQIEDGAEDLDVPFYKLGENEYLLEISCNRAGAYLTQYLFYYIDEENLTANLLSFERFEKNDANVPLGRFVSLYPTGAADFDDRAKKLIIHHSYSSAERCGFDAVYTIKKAQTNLTEMRAEWNCQPGTDSEKWRILNLDDLKKRLPKSVND